LLALAVLAAPACQGGPGRAAAGRASASVSVELFRQRLKGGRAVEACGMLLQPVSEQGLRRVARYAGEMERGECDFAVLEGREDADCAVVIINESTRHGEPAFDLDPLFLVRRDGAWQIMLNSYEFYRLDSEETERLKGLRAWYEGRKTELLRSQGLDVQEHDATAGRRGHG
jgi:hypothetical protein